MENYVLQQLNKELSQAMKSKDSVALTALRGLKSALDNARIQAKHELSDEESLVVVQKEIKKRKESAEIYRTQNRPDLYEMEEKEISIYEKYLPEQMSIEDATTIIEVIVNKLGATTIKDMGKVMAEASTTLAGVLDKKTISEIIKSFLIPA